MKPLSTGSLANGDRQRIVPVRGRITRNVAGCCINRLLVLATESPGEPIDIYIDSAGGKPSELLPILSTIKGIKCPIGTFCRSEAGGVAVFIAAHGKRGSRVAAPGARFSLKHLEREVLQQGRGEPEQFLRLLATILGRDVQKPEVEALEWFRQGAEFTAQEALKQGLIDQISTEPLRLPWDKGLGSEAVRCG